MNAQRPFDERLEADYDGVTEQLNDIPSAGLSEALVHELFECQVRRNPQSVAVICEDQSLTYAQLDARANSVAQALFACGVRPDDRVALYADRSVATIAGLLGILKSGGAYVPLDPNYPVERVAYMLDDSAPVAVLTKSGQMEWVSDTVQHVVCLDTELPHAGFSPRVAAPTSGNLAYVMYTSGSTGRPKGVMVEHRNVVSLWNSLHRDIYGRYGTFLRVSVNASLTFDSSVKQLIQLLTGHTLVMIPEVIRSDANALLNYLAHHRVNSFDCTPAQLDALLSSGLIDKCGSDLRMVLVGGEAINPNLWRSLARIEGIDFYNVYGPTECTVDATFAHIGASLDTPCIGRPLSNTRIHILDANGLPTPPGTSGEIHIEGAGTARGYLNRPDLTARSFVSNPFSDRNPRLYKTGDVGRRLADGIIEYLGRNDRQVKLRGFRIELAEIEARLAAYPGIREAVVVSVAVGQSESRLHAYLTTEDGMAIPTSALRAHLASRLPEYMIPSAYVFLRELPLTPNGKIDRIALPAPDEVPVGGQDHELPEGDTEMALAALWKEVLQLERVGRHQNFFELGGHSMSAMKLLTTIADVLEVRIPFSSVFQHPTLQQMAESIDNEKNRASL